MWQLQHDVSNAFGGQFFLFAIGFFAALVFGGFFIASLGREQIKAHLPIMLLMGTLLLVMFGFPIFKSFQRKSFLEKGAFSEEIGLIEHYFEPTGKGRSWRSITFQVKGKPFELKKSLGSVYVGNGDSVKIHHHEGLVLRVWTYK